MHIDVTPVGSLEYYREQDKQSRRENLQYHGDNEQIERGHSTFGGWVVGGQAGATPLIPGIVHGERVEWEKIDAMSRGVDPATGEPWYTHKGDTYDVADDVTFSSVKEHSIMHALGRAGAAKGGEHAELYQWLADTTEAAHKAGVAAGLKLFEDEGAFEVRYGKAGRLRQRAAYWCAAAFTHYTSRDGDMQLHTHVVVPKAARALNGDIRPIDNHRLFLLRGKAGAVARAEEVAFMKRAFAERGIGYHASKEGRNFRVDGVPEEVKNHFSKRRTKILQEMYANGYTSTAKHREASQVVSYSTRGDKDALPPITELYSRWEFELESLGWSMGSLVENIHTTALAAEKAKDEAWAKERALAADEGITLPIERPDYDLDKLTKAAVGKVTENDATFEARKFEMTMIEHLQVHADAATALALVEKVKAEQEYIKVGERGRAREAVFTDKKTLMREFEILDIENRLHNNVAPIDRDAIARVLARGFEKSDGSGERFHLRPEQATAIYHVLGPDQLSDCVGDAGTGKSTMMKAVKQVLDEVDDGWTLHLCAPTNKAVGGLVKEVGVPVERGFSVARLLLNHEKGDLQLGNRDLVIVDEAGMVPGEDWLKLDRIAEETGCRFVRVGDPKQLPPVAAGAPFRMVIEAHGAARLQEIARQNEEWARNASKDFANANMRDGLMAYEDRGFVSICTNAGETQEKAVAKFFELNTQDPGEVIVLLQTNAEVRRYNREITERKIEAGILTGPAYQVEAIQRGTDGKVEDITVMQGSRLLLGENVRFHEELFANNSMGTVLKIDADEDGGPEPDVTFKWDDGRVIRFKPSEFIGYRESDDNTKSIPKFALADCMTDYAAQGVTSKHCIKGFHGAATMQSLYVGATRHKATFHAFIDGGRIESELAASHGKTFTMGKDGSTNQEDDVPETEISRKEILEQFISEVSRTNSKANACDLLGGPKEFHERNRENYEAGFSKSLDLSQNVDRKKAAMETEKENVSATKEEPDMKTTGDPSKPIVTNPFAKSRVRGLGMTGGQAAAQKAEAAAKETAALIERRMNAPTAPEVATKKPISRTFVPPTQEALEASKKEAQRPKEGRKGGDRSKSRLSQAELDHLVRVDLADYARRTLKMQEEGTETHHGRTFYWFRHANGRMSIERQSDTGIWTYVHRDGGDTGKVIWDLIAQERGGSVGQAMHALRQEFRTESLNDAPSSIPSWRSKFKVPEAAPEVKKKTFAENLLEQRAVVWVKEKLAPVAERFNRMRQLGDKGHAYAEARGLNRETLSTFGRDIRIEYAGEKSKNPNGLAFPHKDLDGNLWTYERKGPKHHPTDERAFSQMAGAGTLEPGQEIEEHRKRLGLLGNFENPERIYVSESQVDGMSLYQLDREAAKAGKSDPIPEKDKILLVSTYGNPSYKGLSDLALLAERNPNTPIHIAMDNDNAGVQLRGKVEEAVKFGRGEEAETVARTCDPHFKDWNNQLLMKREKEEIDANWSKAESKNSSYLRGEGISRETQMQFRDDIRVEGADGIDGYNKQGVMIAMRDKDGEMTGYMRYGMEKDVTTAREFRRPHTVASNDLIRLGNQENLDRLYAGQSAIDVLKVYEHDGRPERSMIAVAEGGFNDQQKAALMEIVQRNPQAAIHYVPDATKTFSEKETRAALANAQKAQAAIVEANPEAKIEERRVPELESQLPREQTPELQRQPEPIRQPEVQQPEQETRQPETKTPEQPKVEDRESDDMDLTDDPAIKRRDEKTDDGKERAAEIAAELAAEEEERRRLEEMRRAAAAAAEARARDREQSRDDDFSM